MNHSKRMNKQEIQKTIDRVVGTKGTLRIPSWWMHKILSDLVKYCQENEDITAIEKYIKRELDSLKAEIGDVPQYRVFGMSEVLEGEDGDEALDHLIVIESSVPLTSDDVIDFTRYLKTCSGVGHRDPDLSNKYRNIRKWRTCTTISTHPRGGQPNNGDFHIPTVQFTLEEIGSPNKNRSTHWYHLIADGHKVSAADFVGPNSWFGIISKSDLVYRWGNDTRRLVDIMAPDVTSPQRCKFDAGFMINGTLVPFKMTANHIGGRVVRCYIKNGA